MAVTRLAPSEAAQFDPDALDALCDRLGETGAEAEVARALDRIAETLGALGTILDVRDTLLLDAAVRTLIRDTDLIGMTTLAHAARAVADCLAGGDRTALAATKARLVRIGERSMHALWDIEDMSG